MKILLSTSIAIFLALAASPRAQDNSFSISPTKTDADKAFRLSLQTYRYQCGYSFSKQQVHVAKGRIDLEFFTTWDSTIICDAILTRGGPVFDVPALAAGSYEVYAIDMPPCAAGPNPCLIKVIPEFAGVLTVGAPPDGWFFTPVEAKAETPFSLRLLNQQYGTCNFEFTHSSLQVGSNSLSASFVIEEYPGRRCIQDVRPHGPAYDVKGLKAGKYTVYATVMPACNFANPPCMAPVPAPQNLGTLTVTGTSAISMSYSRGGIPDRIRIRRGIVEIPLPAGRPGQVTVTGRAISGWRGL